MRDQRRAGILLLRERQHLPEHMLLVLQVPPDALLGRLFKAIQALLIDAIDADDLQPPLQQTLPERMHHPAIFILEKRCLRVGKTSMRGPPRPKTSNSISRCKASLHHL